MKLCPFCGGEPLKHLETAICSTCKITLPIDVWEGRLDTEHIIDGIRWVKAGSMLRSSRFFSEQMPPYFRTDLVKMMQGDWHEAKAAGYCRSMGLVECHRYSTIVGGFLVQCKLEQDAVDIGCKVHAQPVGTEGFIARYSTEDDGVPVMYVASMRASTKETL